MLKNLKIIGASVFFSISVMPFAYGQQTILVANFMNGNNAALNSRIYLWNSSDTAGDITVRVFTLPLRSGFPQELTSTPLSLGALGSKSALNLKLAEDILTPIGLFLPYTDNGGNLTLEFTIGAENVRGVAQVFSGDFAFGTYPLLETTSKIIGSAELADQVDFGATGSRGFVRMLNSTGTVVSYLGTSTIDAGLLNLNGSTGNQTVGLGTTTDNTGALNVFNSQGNVTAFLGSRDDSGLIFVNDSSGNPIVALGQTDIAVGVAVRQSTPDQAVGIVFGDSAGNALGGMAAGNVPGVGAASAFGTIDPTTQQPIAAIGGNRNLGGRVEVYNFFGTQTAGMNGDTGLVFGSLKAFIVDDPTDSSRKIKYTSLEGPEAAIYVRGTASLVSGRAYIEFPDHFSAMAVSSSITVTLTPRSARSMGLAAVDVSTQGIQVAELGGGRNSYAFDYVAHAVRKGHEDYEVYLTKEQANELTGQASRTLQAMTPKKAVK